MDKEIVGSSFLWLRGFLKDSVDRTLFIKHIDETITIAQIYIQDMIFGSPFDSLAHEFAEFIKQEFKMRMVGELRFFLGF